MRLSLRGGVKFGLSCSLLSLGLKPRYLGLGLELGQMWRNLELSGRYRSRQISVALGLFSILFRVSDLEPKLFEGYEEDIFGVSTYYTELLLYNSIPEQE